MHHAFNLRMLLIAFWVSIWCVSTIQNVMSNAQTKTENFVKWTLPSKSFIKTAKPSSFEMLGQTSISASRVGHQDVAQPNPTRKNIEKKYFWVVYNRSSGQRAQPSVWFGLTWTGLVSNITVIYFCGFFDFFNHKIFY